jgi:hypothetical protein
MCHPPKRTYAQVPVADGARRNGREVQRVDHGPALESPDQTGLDTERMSCPIASTWKSSSSVDIIIIIIIVVVVVIIIIIGWLAEFQGHGPLCLLTLASSHPGGVAGGPARLSSSCPTPSEEATMMMMMTMMISMLQASADSLLWFHAPPSS